MRSITAWCVLMLSLVGESLTGVPSSGSALCYYTSGIDGSNQPYGLYLPAPYVPKTPHPVIFIAHGFGGRASNVFTTAQRNFADAHGVLLVRLQGRGNTFYDGAGETDFFEVLANLRAHYTIDMRRLYFEGASMGATGAFRLGIRHPDVLAAVGGVDGWGDYRSWYAQWYGPARDPSCVAPFRLPNLEMASCVDMAESARWQHLFLIADTCDTTVPPVNSYALNARLDLLGWAQAQQEYCHVLQTNIGGHCAAFTATNEMQLFRYFLTQAQPPAPRHISFRTMRLKYGGVYWVASIACGA